MQPTTQQTACQQEEKEAVQKAIYVHATNLGNLHTASHTTTNIHNHDMLQPLLHYTKANAHKHKTCKRCCNCMDTNKQMTGNDTCVGPVCSCCSDLAGANVVPLLEPDNCLTACWVQRRRSVCSAATNYTRTMTRRARLNTPTATTAAFESSLQLTPDTRRTLPLMAPT